MERKPCQYHPADFVNLGVCVKILDEQYSGGWGKLKLQGGTIDQGGRREPRLGLRALEGTLYICYHGDQIWGRVHGAISLLGDVTQDVLLTQIPWTLPSPSLEGSLTVLLQ